MTSSVSWAIKLWTLWSMSKAEMVNAIQPKQSRIDAADQAR